MLLYEAVPLKFGKFDLKFLFALNSTMQLCTDYANS